MGREKNILYVSSFGLNNRIPGALDYFNAEPLQEAFLRRYQPEAILGMFLKWADFV
jgi:hypothetical protein